MNTGNRDLLHQVRRLPREIAPDRDLWPEIHDRIRRASPTVQRRTGGNRPRYWLSLAMAASVLIAVTAAATLWIAAPLSDSDWQAAGTTWQDPSVLAARYAGAVEAEFAPARFALREQTSGQLERMDPEARARVLANLREIDTATQKIRAAIGRDPDSFYLLEMLVATYTQEIEILRQVSQTTQRLQETQL